MSRPHRLGQYVRAGGTAPGLAVPLLRVDPARPPSPLAGFSFVLPPPSIVGLERLSYLAAGPSYSGNRVTVSENSSEKYRQRAAQCLSLAERAERDDDKATWLELAGKWQRLAEEAGRNHVVQQAEHGVPRQQGLTV